MAFQNELQNINPLGTKVSCHDMDPPEHSLLETAVQHTSYKAEITGDRYVPTL